MAKLNHNTDILVFGCGPAGLATASTFTNLGYKVTCIETLNENQFRKNLSLDNRSTAILMPGIDLFNKIGIWKAIKPHSTPIDIMRLADAGGEDGEIRYLADFKALEVDKKQFGFNVPNLILKEQMMKNLEKTNDFSIIFNSKLSKVITRSKEIVAVLDNSLKISAKLIIAADGRGSFLRESYNIKKKTWSYDQKALAFVVSHSEPHKNISTEIHKDRGPFTLVPLNNSDGTNRSAVVWMDRSSKIDTLLAMGSASFNYELQSRSINVLGKIKIEGPKTCWPIISQYSKKLYAERLALIAEAAHVFPPIGAQGLNTSFGDLRCLSNIVEECKQNGQDYGLEEHLERYNKIRWPQIYLKVLGIDALNRAALFEKKILKDLRLQSLKAIHQNDQLRSIAMSSGLGY